MPNLIEATTVKEYASAVGNVLIRNLKKEFILYCLAFFPAAMGGPATIILTFAFGWIFDWVEKNAIFAAFCKYTDFRVGHQGTEFGKAIYLEIQAKKGGNIEDIKKAELEADRLFDNFVVISR